MKGRRNKLHAPHRADTSAVVGVKGFVGIPKCVLKSEAYRHLSLMARVILVEIVARMDGHNNGRITISYGQIADRLNRKNEAPFAPAVVELMEHGFLDLGTESVWQERRAREYRLTFVNTTDSIGRTIKATNDYLHWRAKNDATNGVAEKPKSATNGVAEDNSAAINGVAVTHGKLPKTFRRSATTVVVPIIKPYACAQSEVGWWLTEASLLARVKALLAMLSWLAAKRAEAAS